MNWPRTAALSKINFCRVSWPLTAALTAPVVSVVILLSHLLELRITSLAALHIVHGVALLPGDIVCRQGPHGFCRRADDEHIVGKFLAFRDQGARADQTPFADLRAVQDHGLDADQGAIADRAPMQHRLVADGHVLADVERVARVRVQYGAFLHIAVGAHGDAFIVTAKRGAEPY